MHFVLVGCGAGKRPHASPVADLYTGQLFRAARAWAEGAGDAWAVLSARLPGVLLPGEVVGPYDRRLDNLDPDELRQWELHVGHQFGLAFPGCEGATVTVLAGAAYADAFRRACEDRWSLDVREPLRGLGVGQRLGWFKRGGKAAAVEVELQRSLF